MLETCIHVCDDLISQYNHRLICELFNHPNIAQNDKKCTDGRRFMFIAHLVESTQKYV